MSRADARSLVGDGLLLRGQHAAALAAYRDATSLLAPDERGLRLDLACKRARAMALCGDYQGALGEARAWFELCSPLEDAAAIELAAAAALACWASGSLGEGEEWIARAEVRARRVSHAAHRARTALARATGNLAVAGGRLRDAIGAFRTSLYEARAAEDDWERSIALYNLGEAHAQAHEDAEAERLYREALELKASIGDTWGVAFTHSGLATLALRQHKLGEALERAAEGLRAARATSDPKITARLHCVAAEVEAALGRPEGARSHARRALRAAGDAGASEELERAKKLLHTLELA